MKSFQDWLDCQLYSSHLKNLTKIKEQALSLKTPIQNRRHLKTANNYRNISHLELIQTRNQVRMKPHSIKIQSKQNQIMQQNISLANRLINVSSVISKDKQVESYRKYQSLFKKNSSTNKRFDFLRAKELKKFMKVNDQNYMRGIHKAIIKIKFLSIPRVPEGNSPTIWVELYSGTEKVSSIHCSLADILMHEIVLPFKKKIDTNLMMRLHCSRGLSYLNLGQYYFEKPKKQGYRKYQEMVSHQDSRKLITMQLLAQDLVMNPPNHKSLHIR